MSDENIEDVFDDIKLVEEDEKADEPEDKSSSNAPRGYMTKEAWVASGKDPDEWVSEELFRERGHHIKQTAALRKEFDNQIKNLSMLHQIQLKNQREELLSKRDDAIDIADKAAVKALDKQIKELDDIEKLNTPTQASNKPPEITEWEQDNPWCFDADDPRTKLANRIYREAINEGKTNAGALRAVDKEIASKFSEKSTSPRQIAESSRSAGGDRKASDVVTMKTLTRDEQRAWDSGLFPDEKTFLKAVENDRKGAKQ